MNCAHININTIKNVSHTQNTFTLNSPEVMVTVSLQSLETVVWKRGVEGR